jgi:hypothetical protein
VPAGHGSATTSPPASCSELLNSVITADAYAATHHVDYNRGINSVWQNVAIFAMRLCLTDGPTEHVATTTSTSTPPAKKSLVTIMRLRPTNGSTELANAALHARGFVVANTSSPYSKTRLNVDTQKRGLARLGDSPCSETRLNMDTHKHGLARLGDKGIDNRAR